MADTKHHKGMNKGDLIALMAELSPDSKSKAECERSLNLFIKALMQGLKKHHKITLIGFGSFSVQKRNARKGHNPKTGEPMNIPAYNQPVFKAGSELKKHVAI